MEQMYDIFEYHYVDKKSGLGMVIWSRSNEVAQQIADINSEDSCCEWIPRKRKFKIAVQTNRPPYELEQEQIEESKIKLKRRQEKCQRKKKIEGELITSNTRQRSKR